MQIVVNGLLANYEIINPSGKRSILILHGWGRNLIEWVSMAKLLPSEYRVILLDLPGFGNSSRPVNSDFDLLDYVSFVEEFLRKKGIKDTNLLGHSFGGKIAIVLASRSKIITNLFLISSSGISKPGTKVRAIAYLAKKIKRLIHPFFPLPKEAIYILGSKDYKKAGPLAKIFKNVVSTNVSDYAKNISKKTIIIWGENDPEVPVSSAKTLGKLIPDSRIRIVWGAKHNPHLEYPEKLASILRDYL